MATKSTINEALADHYIYQIGQAAERLEKFQAKGWEIQVESTKALIKMLEEKLDKLEC